MTTTITKHEEQRVPYVVPPLGDVVLYRGLTGYFPAMITGHYPSEVHHDGSVSEGGLNLVVFGERDNPSRIVQNVRFSPWNDAAPHTWVHRDGVFVRGVDAEPSDGVFGERDYER